MKKVSYKKVKVESRYCDYCKRKAVAKCKVCGKDLCVVHVNLDNNEMCNSHLDNIKRLTPEFAEEIDHINPEEFDKSLETVTKDDWIMLKAHEDDWNEIFVFKSKEQVEAELDADPATSVSVYDSDYVVIWHNGKECAIKVTFKVVE